MSVVINGSSSVVTNSGAVYDGIQRGTAVTASGTSVDFTSIPSWVKRITVMFSGLSTNGTSNVQIQLGTSGGIVATGYLGSVWDANTSNTNNSAGFLTNSSTTAAYVRHGSIAISNLTGNTWTASGVISLSNGPSSTLVSGSIALAAALTTVRITTVNGTDTFDAGSINILYE